MRFVRDVLQRIMISLFVFVLAAPALAQTQDEFTIGILAFNPEGFIEEMSALGYVEGETVRYMTISLEGVAPDRIMQAYFEQVQQMISLPVDLLVVQTDTDAVMMRAQTDIPIVFAISDDPVVTGAVASLLAPGGRTTGVVSNLHHTRRLQLLNEINPDTRAVYYLYSANALEGEFILEQVRALGEELGIRIDAAPVSDLETGLRALEQVPEDIDWLFVTPYLPFDEAFQSALRAVSAERNIPIAGFLGFPVEGYVVNYGPDLTITTRQTVQIVDQIMRGAPPADIPVIIAENRFAINLQAAEELGVSVPLSILRQADLIIRPGDVQPPSMFSDS